MASIVIDLQKELMDPNASLLSALNKAYFIARKLKISESREFIENEIKGYPDANNLPEYREIHGVLKAFNPMRGWIYIQCPDFETEKTLSTVHLTSSIAELEASLSAGKENNTLMSPLSSVANNMLTIPMQMAVFYTRYAISAILGTVRHNLLEWALKLEENGILGENLSFTNEEISKAQKNPEISSISIIASAGSTVNIASTDNSIINKG